MVELKLVVGGLHMQVSFLTSPLEQRTDTLRLVSKMLEFIAISLAHLILKEVSRIFFCICNYYRFSISEFLCLI